MGSWNKVRLEIEATKTPDGHIDLDKIRRAKIRKVAELTQRPLIVYASDFLNKPMPETAIDFNDKEGFREVTQGLSGEAVDVLLHSPGGMAEAAESIVKLLRARFKAVRFIVPNIAKSAATMLALSGDEIMMDTDAELGPIDPQFNLRKADGTTVVAPAQAIIDQFDRLENRIKSDPHVLPVYIPIIQIYAPSLYQQAKNAIELSKKLVSEWLSVYMFASMKARDRGRCAAAVAKYLSDHNQFKSHSKGVRAEDFRKVNPLKPTKVIDLATQADLQQEVQELYAAISLTFSMSSAFKLFENSQDDAMIRHVRPIQIPIPMGVQQVIVPQAPEVVG